MNRRQCEVCGRENILFFKCNYCGKSLCVDHHLPEKHNCAYQPKVAPPYIRPGVSLSKETLSELRSEYRYLEEQANKKRVSSKEQRKGSLILLASLIFVIGCAYFVVIDRTPPTITIISPETKIYDVDTVALTYTVNEPVSWACYSLNDAEKITLTRNTTLRNLDPGRYNLTIYANDTAGNMGFSTVSFTVTYMFDSLDEFISFLREDDLNNRAWSINYTCVEFAEDFIERAEMKGYYCFVRYDLWGNELDEYINTVESIKVVKNVPRGTETRWYWIPRIGVGHAVVITMVDGIDVVVDPQTDIILAMEDFAVLYEGEITQD